MCEYRHCWLSHLFVEAALRTIREKQLIVKAFDQPIARSEGVTDWQW